MNIILFASLEFKKTMHWFDQLIWLNLILITNEYNSNSCTGWSCFVYHNKRRTKKWIEYTNDLDQYRLMTIIMHDSIEKYSHFNEI